MPRLAYVYITLISMTAAVLLAALQTSSHWSPSITTVLPVLSFLGVGILAEAMAVDFRVGHGKKAKSSLAFLPFLASIVLFEPAVAVTSVALVLTTSQFLLHRNDVARSLFNVSQGIVASTLAALVYRLVLGDIERGGIHWLGFAALATVFFASNLLLSSLALSLIRSQSFHDVFSRVVGAKGANLWYDLLASPIALVPVGLYSQYNIGGLLIIVLPLLLIRYSYLSKVQLEEANKDLLRVLIKAIETRDPYTSGHSMRVATLAGLVANDVGLSRRQVELVETAALLHDIGKIDSAYEAVIRKPHGLTGTERDLIRTHATRGADLLETLSSVNEDVVRAVRHHHERFDGTGYPSGLVADGIPIAARIIMLCDSVDAMLSDRPYRQALSIAQTRAELIRCAGSQFDPHIVRVILGKNTLERAAALAPRTQQRVAQRRLLSSVS